MGRQVIAPPEIIPDSNLTPTELAHLGFAREMASSLCKEVRVYAYKPEFDAQEDGDIIALYSTGSRRVYIRPHRLREGGLAIVDTVAHELGHHTSGADDGTSEHTEGVRRIGILLAQKLKDGAFDGVLVGVSR